MMLPTGGGCSRSASEKPVPTEKRGAVGQLDEQGAQPALVLAGAGQVPEDAGLGVVEASSP